MAREIGNPQNLERLNVEFYFTPLGDAGAINGGNVLMIGQQTGGDSVKGVFNTRAATTQEVRNDQKDSTLKWKVKLNEHTAEMDAILLMGKVGPDFAQAAVTVDATKDIVTTKRRSFPIGKYKLTGVTAAVGGAAKIRGIRDNGEIVPANADYVVDYLLGKIYIPETSTIADGATLTVTYRCEALEGKTIVEAGQRATRRGAFELIGFAGEETIRKVFRFDGSLKPTEYGDTTIDSMNEYSFEVTATGDVVVQILS